MSPTTDIDSHINTPETGTIETITIKDSRASETIMGIIMGIGWIPLQDDLVHPVTINIGHRSIVGRISKGLSVGCNTTIGFL